MSKRDPTKQNDLQGSIDEHAARLVVRLDGHGSAELQSEAEAWIEADPRHAVAFARADARWRTAARLRLRDACGDNDSQNAGHMASQPGQAAWPAKRQWRPAAGIPMPDALAGSISRRHAVAAMAAIGAVGWSSWYFATRPDQRATRFGERSVTELADGSTISLNSDSSVAIDLQASVRKVWLERGEAYFEIARDVSRPFLVQTQGARIAVLGTKFNVRRRGSRTELTVTEGLVAVTPPGGASVHVPANSIATIEENGVLVTRDDPLTVEGKVAWSKGFIQFDNERLGDIVAEFNRYRATPIQIADAQTASIEITGRFGINEGNEFLAALESSFDLKLARRGDQVIVSR